MDENGQDSEASMFSRYRSPTFRQAEVKLLIQLIDKYKYAVLKKSTNSAANIAKEKAWQKIAKEFNDQGLGIERTAEVLKTKWTNLKKPLRRLTKDVMDDECDFRNEEIKKTIAMIYSAENGINGFEEQNGLNNSEDETEDVSWRDNDITSFGLDDEKIQRKMKTETPKKCLLAPGFSAGECRTLLQCVRLEKNVLFSKASRFKRHLAWKRISQNFNRQSPRKRSPKELNTKFNNMKAMTKKVNIKSFFKDIKGNDYEQLDDRMDQKIKSEPIIDCVSDFDSDDDKALDGNPIARINHSSVDNLAFTQDPLNNAHNSDSGLGSISDTKDVNRLKVELVNYKMETAKLQRKRIEDLLRADEKEREMRELEQTLRLRAARLEVAAAELKLPPSHPALNYTDREKRAQSTSLILNG